MNANPEACSARPEIQLEPATHRHLRAPSLLPPQREGF